MMKSINLDSYEIVNDMLLLKWDNDVEHVLLIKSIRDNCPCASCAGEKDVFGNIYKGPKKQLANLSFIILKINLIGHYAIRVFWKDGHSNGIYTFKKLKSLSE